MSAPRTCVRCFVFITILFCFLDLEPLIDYQDCKKQKTPKENPQDLSTKKPGMSWARTFFRGFVFFCLFVLLQFFVFGSGSLHRLLGLGLQKTQKHLRKTKRTKNKIKMFGPRTFFRGLKFLLSLFFVLLDPDDVFIGYQDCKETKTLQENGKTSGKTENPEDSQECLGPGFSSFFLISLVFL